MAPIRSTLWNATNVAYHLLIGPIALVLRWTKRRLGWLPPVEVMTYHGFGNKDRIHVLGRVQELRDIPEPREDDSWLQNLRAILRRFRTQEIPGIGIEARIGGAVRSGRTDDDGYFDVELPAPPDLDGHELWHPFEVRLTEAPGRNREPVQGVGRALVPCAESTFGVISDIDDTVMYSHATDLWKLIRLTALHNSRTRTPLLGAAELYRALHEGADGARRNPFYYVSSAAWKLYDLVQDFLAFHGFPEGPLLMRDFGIRNGALLRSCHAHKVEKVERIFRTTGDLPFLLIGDAGQADPVLYHEIASEYPDRVAAIYIRAVSWLDRSAEVERLAKDLAGKGVEMMLVEDSERAAEHAVEHGFIPQAALEGIAAGRRADRARKSGA